MITAAYELRPHFRNQLGFTPVGSLFSSVFLSVSLSILELDPTVTPKMAQFKDRVAGKTEMIHHGCLSGSFHSPDCHQDK